MQLQRRHLAIACVLATAFLRSNALAQCGPTPRDRQARVTVSAREAVVVFPCDTANVWGRARRPDQPVPVVYQWGVLVDAVSGSVYLHHTVRDPGLAGDRMPTLEALTDPDVKRWGRDTTPGLRTSVEGGRVVFRIRDAASVARLFGLRPAFVRINWTPSTGSFDHAPDSVPVRYVAPHLPRPTAAMHARAADAVRHQRESDARRMRYVGLAGASSRQPIWLEVGDSTTVQLVMDECFGHVCMGGKVDTATVHWAVADTSVAHVEAHGDLWTRTRFVPRRVGATLLTVRYRGTDGRDSTLTTPVTVVPRVARLQITPRDGVAPTSDGMTVRVRVTADDGSEITGAPVALEQHGRDGGRLSTRILSATEPARLRFEGAGWYVLSARLRGHVDTLRVLVRPPSVRRIVLLEARVVRVRVMRQDTAEPVPDAEVRLPALGRSVRTDVTGEAVFHLVPVGPLRVEVAHPDHEPNTADVEMPDGYGWLVEMGLRTRGSRRAPR